MIRSTHFRNASFGTDPRRPMLRAIGVQQQMQPVTPPPGGEGEGEGSGDDKPMTRAEITAMINSTVTGAVTRQSKALEGSLTKTIQDSIAKLAPAPKGDDEGGEDKGTKGAPTKKDPAISKLERELAEMKDKNAEAEKRAAAATQAAQAKEADTALRAALTGKVRPELLGVAVDALKARGAVQFGEDGAPLLRLKSKQGDLTDYSVEDGIAEFIKSPEGAALVPAPSSGGTGTPRGAGGARGTFNPASKPLSQWTEAERQSYLDERMKVGAEAQSKNPLG
jgi:hypothetical protein